jgi:hypothetical protein
VGLLPRPFVLILVAVVALAAPGCGVRAGDDASTTSTGPDAVADQGDADDQSDAEDPENPLDQATIDRMREVYTDLGFTDEEADCLAQAMGGLLDEGAAFEPDDTTALMDVLNTCDISMSRMMELGEGTDGTLEGGFKAGIAASLRAQGLTADQATCVADAYVERYGTDPTLGADPDAMAPLLEDCGA